MKVGGVMTSAVWAVNSDTPLKEVARLLVERKISGLPVVDADRRILGVVSQSDLLLKERDGRAEDGGLFVVLHPTELPELARKLAARTAGDAMTAPAVTIGRDERVGRAAALMLEAGVKRLPVVKDGKLEGIVTRGDLVRAFARRDEAIAREVREQVMRSTRRPCSDEVHVTVDEGVVELAGYVENQRDAEALVESAGRVPGVVGVRSALTWDRAVRAPG